MPCAPVGPRTPAPPTIWPAPRGPRATRRGGTATSPRCSSTICSAVTWCAARYGSVHQFRLG
uniref:Uncharacterized protein n=1 Tax=Streptantibioticus cattleyicolor TaxID=29303 RepID=Q83XM8_STRCT|nr:hypothetical protein [Streptantibioticus cattleyicolor]